MKKVLDYFRHEVVLTVALIAAVLSFLLVPPGAHTLAGIDTTTLLMLFALMTIVAGFRHMGAFDKLAGAVTSRIHTLRGLAMVLMSVCFLLAMVATNDVALITLVPFTLLLMRGAKVQHLTLTVVLETIAANLGSMVTPIGNPQNLYLYSSGRLAAVVLVAVFIVDRAVLKQVDYTLLATFVCFFVFVASVKAYAPISAWLEELMAGSPLVTSLLVSQVISNVPACLLLSPFTKNVPALMLGVNIGGLGTIVASLASLISFRLYGNAEGAKKGLFMGVFTLLNVLFLAAMLVLAWLLGAI